MNHRKEDRNKINKRTCEKSIKDKRHCTGFATHCIQNNHSFNINNFKIRHSYDNGQ